MNHEFITVVSGLPRSGTSLMMQMLQAGGLPALTDGVRSADESNPRGYFEFEPVKRLRADRSWLDQARGRAVKIIHLLLRELPLDGSQAYRVIFMQRPIEEVLASQHAMLQRDGRPSGDPAVLRQAFENQLVGVDSWMSGHPEIAAIRMPYHRVVSDPKAVAEELRSFLALDLDVAAMASAVDPTLHRQRS
jgi:hypothetical protein